jgi:putative addiction module killer protein
MTIEIRQHEQFVNFLNSVKDKAIRGAILARISRLSLGNPGDHAPVGEGVYELRIHLGAGWRVYYGKVGDRIILLVGGGSKNGQQRDIDAAIERFQQYRKKSP